MPSSLHDDLKSYQRVVSQLRQEFQSSEMEVRKDMIAGASSCHDPGLASVITVVTQTAHGELLERLNKIHRHLVQQRILQEAQEKRQKPQQPRLCSSPKTTTQ